jgi:hypothetical protein
MLAADCVMFSRLAAAWKEPSSCIANRVFSARTDINEFKFIPSRMSKYISEQILETDQAFLAEFQKLISFSQKRYQLRTG